MPCLCLSVCLSPFLTFSRHLDCLRPSLSLCLSVSQSLAHSFLAHPPLRSLSLPLSFSPFLSLCFSRSLSRSLSLSLSLLLFRSLSLSVSLSISLSLSVSLSLSLFLSLFLSLYLSLSLSLSL